MNLSPRRTILYLQVCPRQHARHPERHPPPGLAGGDARIAAQHEEAIEAGFVSRLAGVDLEGAAAAGGAQVAPIGGVANQRLVAALELPVERLDDGAAIGGILLRLGLVAADDVAAARGDDRLDEQLGVLAAAALDAERVKGWVSSSTTPGPERALADAEDVFQSALLVNSAYRLISPWE